MFRLNKLLPRRPSNVFNGSPSINLNRNRGLSPNYKRPVNPNNFKQPTLPQSYKTLRRNKPFNVNSIQRKNKQITQIRNKRDYFNRATQNKQSGLRFQRDPSMSYGNSRKDLLNSLNNVNQRSRLIR